MAEISRSEWKRARKWNREHSPSEGRFVAAVSPRRRKVRMWYLSKKPTIPGYEFEAEWSITTFPRENGKTVSRIYINGVTGREAHETIPLEWVP